MNNAPIQPARLLKNQRALWKFIVFGILTCGIYYIVIWTGIGEDINLAATKRDGKKTTHYCLVCFLLSWLTLGIYPIVWQHKISNRIGDEARARGMQTNLSASSYWLWFVLGSMILVGPFVYLHKVCKAVNYIADSYNSCGM